MPDPATDLTMPWPTALAVILGCVTIALLFARLYARRERRRIRQQARDLARDFSAFLDSRITRHELREAVEDASSGTFWSAIEVFASRLPRAEWLMLSRALERCRHVARERRALADESPWRAELAARRLATVRSVDSRRALRRALARGPELLSHAAARALARFGDRGALRWLLQHPDRLSKRSVKQWAALLRMFGPAACPHLLEALEACRDTPVLERALIEGLGQAGDLASAAIVERRLHHADLEMRVSAARSLGRMRATQCTPGLLEALKDDAWQVRAQAAWALGRARANHAIYTLTTRLTDRSWWVRRHAAYALAEMGDEGLSALARAADSSVDPYARDIAQEVLSGGFNKRPA